MFKLTHGYASHMSRVCRTKLGLDLLGQVHPTCHWSSRAIFHLEALPHFGMPGQVEVGEEYFIHLWWCVGIHIRLCPIKISRWASHRVLLCRVMVLAPSHNLVGLLLRSQNVSLSFRGVAASCLLVIGSHSWPHPIVVVGCQVSDYAPLARQQMTWPFCRLGCTMM